MTKVVNMKVKDEEVGTQVEYHKARDVFGIRSPLLDFDVPIHVEKNQHVPEIDPNYEFKAEYLSPVLWGLINNEKTWLSGHTGTGKSTLIKQICARLNWGLMRVNFDSEISRMDLVGRDVLEVDKSGNTVSRFVDGILPTAIQGPYVLLCDEVDFIRPDVAYVMQRSLEDEGLLISEDGGRVIKPHQWSRIVATANTQGQGDDHGIYQGARAQSMAFLDRFTVWVTCDYMEETQEKRLLKETVKGINDNILKQVMDYTREHRQAFEKQQISQPMSPRSVVSLAKSAVFYESMDNDNPVMTGAIYGLLNKANKTDRAVMDGILNRVTVSKKDAIRLEEEKKKAKRAEYKKRKEELEAKKKAREAGIVEEKVEMSPF
jgi:cobaltochelatase CobS